MVTMKEPSGLEILSKSRRFKLGAGSLFILHMAVCRWLLMPWQTEIEPQSHEHSWIGAASQKCRYTTRRNIIRWDRVRTGSRRLMMRISQRTNINRQICPIRRERKQVYGQLTAFCVWPTRLPRPSTTDDTSCSPQGTKRATNHFFLQIHHSWPLPTDAKIGSADFLQRKYKGDRDSDFSGRQ